jgi:hypothetical protein
MQTRPHRIAVLAGDGIGQEVVPAGQQVLEALAAGLPVAAYPVTGPREVLEGSGCGVMAEDLAQAALAALDIPRERCRVFALSRTMAESNGTDWDAPFHPEDRMRLQHADMPCQVGHVTAVVWRTSSSRRFASDPWIFWMSS